MQRRGIPERLLLPPGPREPALAATWAALPFEERRRLAQLDADHLPGRAEPVGTSPAGPGLDPGMIRALAAGLARARLATAWRALSVGPALGWLVLMTVWGFGRSTAGAAEDGYLLAGLALGATTWIVASRHALARLRRARSILHRLAEGDS